MSCMLLGLDQAPIQRRSWLLLLRWWPRNRPNYWRLLSCLLEMEFILPLHRPRTPQARTPGFTTNQFLYFYFYIFGSYKFSQHAGKNHTEESKLQFQLVDLIPRGVQHTNQWNLRVTSWSTKPSNWQLFFSTHYWHCNHNMCNLNSTAKYHQSTIMVSFE